MNNGMIVMLARNGLNYCKSCLPTLLAQTVPTSVLVVDNASSDGTASWLRSQQTINPTISRLTYRDVVSVATAWNDGLRVTWAQGHEEVLVVNQDTELLSETYEALRLWSQTMCGESNETRPGMVTCVSRRSRDELRYSEITSRPHPDFSCFMLAKWAWEKVGGFDENCVGGFFEDNVFHVEAHRRGVRCVSISVPFLHHGSTTLKQADAEERKRIESNVRHNRQYFLGKYGCLPGTKAYKRLFLPEIVVGPVF